MSETRPSVAVVVVTYNSADVVDDCLRSISLGMAGVGLAEVVVVDNDSTDETVRIVKGFTALPVTLVQTGRNGGYAAGINAGIATLDGVYCDAVLVLNPDCRLRRDSVRVLADALSRPRCAIAVPKLINPDGSLQPTLRRAPTVHGAIIEALIGGIRAGRASSRGELVTDASLHDMAGEAVWATGAAMLISAAAAQALGPWDESFFLYSEETEYMLRARDHGWHVWYTPDAVVEHIGGEGGIDPALSALITVNKVRLFRRRRGTLPSCAYYAVTLLGQAARAAAGRPTARASLAALLWKSRRLRLPGQAHNGPGGPP